MSDAIRLFRFLSADSALKTIRQRAFKVGRIAELNDPFEWRIGVAGVLEEFHDRVRVAQQEIIDNLTVHTGIMCFSDTATDPILWSHYADQHRGVAFEVEYAIVPSLYQVSYSDDRPIVDVRNLFAGTLAESYLEPIVRRLFVQKSRSWAYEREYRVFINLKECVARGSMFFTKIPEDFLKRVILGFRCSLAESNVRDELEKAGMADVKVVRAKDCCESYAIRC